MSSLERLYLWAKTKDISHQLFYFEENTMPVDRQSAILVWAMLYTDFLAVAHDRASSTKISTTQVTKYLSEQRGNDLLLECGVTCH